MTQAWGSDHVLHLELLRGIQKMLIMHRISPQTFACSFSVFEIPKEFLTWGCAQSD